MSGFISKYKVEIAVFLSCLIIRVLFVIFSGFNNYQLSGDSEWIIMLSEKVVSGNFDFDIQRFIAAPFYQSLVGVIKLIFGSKWEVVLVCFQLIIASLSGIYIYRLAILLFKRKDIGIVAASVFAFFPMTLWWVHTFASEVLFQSVLIISVYYLVSGTISMQVRHIIFSAFLLAICFLSKSHILVFTPFIVIYFFLTLHHLRDKIVYSVIYGSICILMSIPFGVYNLIKHDTFVLSSNGAGCQFYLGHSNVGYITIVDVPEKGTEEYKRMKYVNAEAGFFNGSRYDSIMELPQAIKQKVFFQDGLTWIKNNPEKFIELKVYDLVLFLMPGVSYRHYSLMEWLFSFMISLPVYLLGYIGIVKALKLNFEHNFWILGLFLTMIIFSVGFYVQNRFRTVTLEPFYIIYASYAFITLFENSNIYKAISKKTIEAKLPINT